MRKGIVYLTVWLLSGALLSACASGESREVALMQTVDSSEEESSALPLITADTDRISPASVSFPIKNAEGDIEVLADLNHDGEQERIRLGLRGYAESGGMEYGTLKVLKGTGASESVLWEEEYGTAHAGWNMLYLYQEAGEDYLVRYSPYMNTGRGDFQLSVFSLDDQGEPVPLADCGTSFSLTEPEGSGEGFYGSAGEMTAFLKEAESYLSRSLLLVSTDEGRLAYSTPEAPITLRHSHMEWCGGWDVTGSGNVLEVFELAERKGWLGTEGIPALCKLTDGQPALKVDMSIKGARREELQPKELMEMLFQDLEGDNWTYLGEERQPEEEADVLISISRTPGRDLYISCFADEELAVIWSAPYVVDLDNHMAAFCECYRLSKAAIEELTL